MGADSGVAIIGEFTLIKNCYYNKSLTFKTTIICGFTVMQVMLIVTYKP